MWPLPGRCPGPGRRCTRPRVATRGCRCGTGPRPASRCRTNRSRRQTRCWASPSRATPRCRDSSPPRSRRRGQRFGQRAAGWLRDYSWPAPSARERWPAAPVKEMERWPASATAPSTRKARDLIAEKLEPGRSEAGPRSAERSPGPPPWSPLRRRLRSRAPCRRARSQPGEGCDAGPPAVVMTQALSVSGSLRGSLRRRPDRRRIRPGSPSGARRSRTAP